MEAKSPVSIQQATANKPAEKASQSVSALLNSILDSSGMRKRLEDLLKERTPSFVSSIITLCNADQNLQKAAIEAPMTIIQSALKAATFDLPIEPALGYAYLVPFNNRKSGHMEAQMIIGYKGLEQLCLRTGAYSRVPDAIDVRQGELISYDRLTGDAEFKWVEDEDEREKLPVIGYAGYFRLKNGAEKTIYMTKKQIEAHEKKNRKGDYQGKGWRDDWDSMARKTVIRRLISRYGLMSIQYQSGDAQTVSMATELIKEDEPELNVEYTVDTVTGEVSE